MNYISGTEKRVNPAYVVNKGKCGRREGHGGQILWGLTDTKGGGRPLVDFMGMIYTLESASWLMCGDETTRE